ncbi:primosomal protein DnaI [Tuanshanicoccus lijuaniae]|uniref:primosomal protein DnaI n=1 Tax=Aerococcaceae bacterium zg-1292 TaxID=2774330 RepID=UPI001BD8C1BA|nr:primosomal protein DnaI [Aerococcaceae bacterium zg-A91]MBS4458659.1 primosomal protein DnaI [Aerococcaceae bacterium zg-BR33]
MQTIQEILQKIMELPHFNEYFQATVKRILHHEAVQQFINEHSDDISQEMIQNSLSKLNEFVLEHDAYQRGEDGKNPGFKPVLFLNQNYIDIAYRPTDGYLKRQQDRKAKALLENRMMSRDVREASWDRLKMDTPSRKQLVNEITRFVSNYRQHPETTQGLYISGPFGVGKTYVLGALANSLAQTGVKVTMLHFPTFANNLKKSIETNGVHELVNDTKKVPILMLDDIGSENNSAWIRDDVLGVILEYRMKESMPTFFTSNFSMDELEQHLATTREGVEKVKAARLMERMRYVAKEVQLDGENLRQKLRGVVE